MRKRIVRGLIVIVCLLLLTATVTVFELPSGWRGYDNFIGIIVNTGWFGFVLVRIVSLFLLALAVRRVWRWSRANR